MNGATTAGAIEMAPLPAAGIPRDEAISATRMVKVLVADDHTIIREGLKQILALVPDMMVIGDARNVQETLDAARSLEWDVMILAYSMHGGNGLAVLREIKQSFPTRPVLMLSVYPEEGSAIAALRAGASGYLDKECAIGELSIAIRQAFSGKRYVNAALAERLAMELQNGDKGPPHESLSDREYRVMCMLAGGKAVSRIAEELQVSPNTISTYRNRILKKLGIKNNAYLVRYAIKHGLTD